MGFCNGRMTVRLYSAAANCSPFLVKGGRSVQPWEDFKLTRELNRQRNSVERVGTPAEQQEVQEVEPSSQLLRRLKAGAQRNLRFVTGLQQYTEKKRKK